MRYVAARDQPWGERAGNYWSNYAGWDRDGDGIAELRRALNDAVDTPTYIETSAGAGYRFIANVERGA